MFEMLYTKLFLKIKVVGTDAAGISTVNYMLKKNMQGINFFAFADDVSKAKTFKDHKFLKSDTEKFLSEMSDANLIFIVGKENFDTDILKSSGALTVKVPSDKNNSEEFSYKLVKNFVEIFTLPGYPKIDFPKLYEVMENEGKNIVGFSEGFEPVEGIKDIMNTTKKVIDAKKILFNITTSAGNFSCEDAEEIVNFLSRIAPNAEISFGCSIDNFIDNEAKIILIANG